MGALEIRDPRAPHGKSYLGYHLLYRTFTLHASLLDLTRASRSVEEIGIAHLANSSLPRILCAAEFLLETNEIHDNKLLPRNSYWLIAILDDLN